MSVDPFECPKCGSRMLNDLMNYGYRCVSCGNHEPFGHTGGAGARAPAPAAGIQAGSPAAGARPAASPAGTGQGITDTLFRPQTLSNLASITCIVYRGQGITDLFRRSGFPPVWNYRPGNDWRFLYGALERLQQNFGPYGVTKILEAACDPQDGLARDNAREEINECLSPYGIRIGEDGRARRLEAKAAAASEAALFDQRNYHKAVIEHARPPFLKGEYFGAAREGLKVLEELIRTRSGIDDYGARLVQKALGDSGALEADLADLTGTTRKGIRRGLESGCTWMLSSVRNPASHEYETKFIIGRADALDILTAVSYLCRQVEKMRRRPGQRPAQPKGDRGGGPETPGPEG